MATEPKLLTRDQFRASVFARDGHTCVFCGAKAADAHHIIERKLWGNGGYYLDNGASVCEPCHLRCESTEFSVWNQRNMCLSWDETQEWFQLLGVTSVPVLYDGVYDEDTIRDLAKKLDFSKNEGYVVRRADSFSYSQFRTHLAKFVRPSHVQTNRHWSSQAVIKNKLG